MSSEKPASTEKFLYVKVKRGSSRQQLLAAITDALAVHEPLPTFKDHNASTPASTSPNPTPAPTPVPDPGGGLGPDEGLLIFCKDEGGNG